MSTAAVARIPWISYLCLASSMALVGSYVGLSKLLVVAFPVFLLAWLRFAIAAVAMVGWVRRGAEPPLATRDRRLLFLESFFGNFLFSICMLFGIAQSTALAAGVIMAALPAVVALLSWALLGERITPRVALAIGCAVGGIALVSLARGDGGDGSGSLLGSLLLFGAVSCEAIYVVIGKKLTARVGPKRISALINLWGLALVTPFGLWQALGFDFGAVGAALVGAAARLFDRRQRADGLALDDRPPACRLLRRPASSRCCCRSAPRLVGVAWLGEHLSTVQDAGLRAGAGRRRARDLAGDAGGTGERRDEFRRLRLQAVVRPHLAPAARARLAVPQPEHVARRMRPRLAAVNELLHVGDSIASSTASRSRTTGTAPKKRLSQSAMHPRVVVGLAADHHAVDVRQLRGDLAHRS